MPVLPSFFLSFCLVLRSSAFGAIVVASLDFWLNLGLSSLEKASRLCGLSFGRIIFEFGSPVVPDLTTAVGTAGSPSCAVLLLPLGRYYCLGGTAAYGQRYYRCLPDSIIPYLCLIHVVLFGGLRFFFFRVGFLFVCLVPGDEHPEQQVRRVNPGHSTSKRYRTSESARGSSSAPPPPVGDSSSANPQRQKKLANRPKPRAKTVTEMSAKEF